MGLEGFAEVEEVVPSRVGGDEAHGHVEAGMVVHGEQEGLLVRPWPPLVNGTVVLPKFADFGTAESSIDTVLSRWCGDEVCEVSFDVGLNARTGASELAKAFEFVADKLVVGRVLHRQEALEEIVGFCWPETVVVASACLRAVGFATSQPSSPHAIKMGSADAKLGGSGRGIQESLVEFIECLENEVLGKSVDDLLLFKSVESTSRTNHRDQLTGDFGAPLVGRGRHRRLALRRPSLRSALLRANLRWRLVSFCSVSVSFCSGPDTIFIKGLI